MTKIALVLAALAVAITPALAQKKAKAENVQLAASAEEVAKCKRIGEVGGRSFIGGGWATFGQDRVMKQMKRKTAEAGGNWLLLLSTGAHYGGANGVGIAYRC